MVQKIKVGTQCVIYPNQNIVLSGKKVFAPFDDVLDSFGSFLLLSSMMLFVT